MLRRAPELEAERQPLDRWLAAPPDKVLALVAQMDDPAAMPEGAGPVTYACPMHPEITSDKPGRCPKCGMKLLATAAPTSYVCPMHPEVVIDQPGRCPKCGMKLLPAASVPKPVAAADAAAMEDHDGHAAGHDHHGEGHGTADGIEWEDDMVEVNRLTTTATMHWKFLDRTSGADSPAIDWQFTVGERVKIRLVNEMDLTTRCTTRSTCTGGPVPGAFPRRGARAQPGLEGHGAGPHRPDRGHLVRCLQPGPVDGPLPHRRAHAERHDVQLQRCPRPGVRP